MKIRFSVIASTRDSAVSVDGAIITVDGTEYDTSAIDSENPSADGVVSYRNGFFIVIYQYDKKSYALNQSTDASDYIVDNEVARGFNIGQRSSQELPPSLRAKLAIYCGYTGHAAINFLNNFQLILTDEDNLVEVV